jgi:YVTN family beta-propeller protein
MICKQKHTLISVIILLYLPLLLSAQWLETTIAAGNSPYALAYNSVNNKIYCGNYGSDDVTVIDGATNSVIATVTAGDNPLALAYNSSNNKVYCVNVSSGNVTVIDGATNSLITTITVGSYPHALVHNPNENKVYCANGGTGDVTVIDGATNSVITTITVGNSPDALVYNSINNKVYCANAGSNNVTVIDGAANSVITTITVGSWPRAFAWNPVQNRTYVANYNSSSVSVIRDVTGVEEDQKHDVAYPILQIFPNPAKTSFTIQTTTPVRNVKLYDVLGRMLTTAEMTIYKNEETILVKHLSAGVYFVKVSTVNNESLRKVIVTE